MNDLVPALVLVLAVALAVAAILRGGYLMMWTANHLLLVFS